MEPVQVDFSDVQGLARYGYRCLHHAAYFLASIKDPGSARAWLAKQEFTSAAAGRAPDEVLQVALSFAGLQALGISQAIQEGFPTDFRSGMTGDQARSRRLGDTGCNDPDKWIWGGPGNVPHLLITVIAKSAPALAALEARIKCDLWAQAFDEPLYLPTSDMDEHEPFGFKDGVSQPKPDWERRLTPRDNTYEYTNRSALGEFLLGYPNEYALCTDRPLLSLEEDPNGILLPAEDVPNKKDFTRNGTYLVMRDLAQDVAGFQAYVNDRAKQMPGKNYSFAEAMVGRRKCGEPIVALDALPIEGVKEDEEKDWKYNRFTFRSDPHGWTCPFGAHIRRANPRNADLPEGTKGWLSFLWRMLGFGGRGTRYDLLESVRFHRILRRGREYGPLIGDQVGKGRRPGEEGLRFICLNANILRQFEFLQNSWITNPRFNGLEEADPLLGNREKLCAGGDTNTFTWPQPSGINRRYEGLPAFVTVRGGAYFFMPGLRALRYICNQ
jgi:Dyp-type peroxidase family